MKHNPFSCNGKTRWCANAAEAPMDQSHYWTEPSLSLSDTVQGKTTRTHHEIEQIKAQRGISNSAEAKKKKKKHRGHCAHHCTQAGLEPGR